MTFPQRQLAALEEVLDSLASDHATTSFVQFRIFTLEDRSLYPKDWKKLTKIERTKWIDKTKGRLNSQLKGIEKEVRQLNKFIKFLSK